MSLARNEIVGVTPLKLPSCQLDGKSAKLPDMLAADLPGIEREADAHGCQPCVKLPLGMATDC